jgi:hypothetical protein
MRYKTNASSVEINFGVVKLRFTYLFLIAETKHEIFESIRLYYKENRIIPTAQQNLLSSSRRMQQSSLRKGNTMPLNISINAKSGSDIS